MAGAESASGVDGLTWLLPPPPAARRSRKGAKVLDLLQERRRRQQEAWLRTVRVTAAPSHVSAAWSGRQGVGGTSGSDTGVGNGGGVSGEDRSVAKNSMGPQTDPENPHDTNDPAGYDAFAAKVVASCEPVVLPRTAENQRLASRYAWLGRQRYDRVIWLPVTACAVAADDTPIKAARALGVEISDKDESPSVWRAVLEAFRRLETWLVVLDGALPPDVSLPLLPPIRGWDQHVIILESQHRALRTSYLRKDASLGLILPPPRLFSRSLMYLAKARGTTPKQERDRLVVAATATTAVDVDDDSDADDAMAESTAGPLALLRCLLAAACTALPAGALAMLRSLACLAPVPVPVSVLLPHHAPVDVVAACSLLVQAGLACRTQMHLPWRSPRKCIALLPMYHHILQREQSVRPSPELPAPTRADAEALVPRMSEAAQVLMNAFIDADLLSKHHPHVTQIHDTLKQSAENACMARLAALSVHVEYLTRSLPWCFSRDMALVCMATARMLLCRRSSTSRAVQLAQRGLLAAEHKDASMSPGEVLVARFTVLQALVASRTRIPEAQACLMSMLATVQNGVPASAASPPALAPSASAFSSSRLPSPLPSPSSSSSAMDATPARSSGAAASRDITDAMVEDVAVLNSLFSPQIERPPSPREPQTESTGLLEQLRLIDLLLLLFEATSPPAAPQTPSMALAKKAVLLNMFSATDCDTEAMANLALGSALQRKFRSKAASAAYNRALIALQKQPKTARKHRQVEVIEAEMLPCLMVDRVAALPQLMRIYQRRVQQYGRWDNRCARVFMLMLESARCDGVWQPLVTELKLVLADWPVRRVPSVWSAAWEPMTYLVADLVRDRPWKRCPMSTNNWSTQVVARYRFGIAERMFAKRRWQAVVDEAELIEHPSNLLHWYQAVSYDRLGMHKQAISIYRQLVNAGRNSLPAWMRRFVRVRLGLLLYYWVQDSVGDVRHLLDSYLGKRNTLEFAQVAVYYVRSMTWSSAGTVWSRASSLRRILRDMQQYVDQLHPLASRTCILLGIESLAAVTDADWSDTLREARGYFAQALDVEETAGLDESETALHARCRLLMTDAELQRRQARQSSDALLERDEEAEIGHVALLQSWTVLAMTIERLLGLEHPLLALALRQLAVHKQGAGHSADGVVALAEQAIDVLEKVVERATVIGFGDERGDDGNNSTTNNADDNNADGDDDAGDGTGDAGDDGNDNDQVVVTGHGGMNTGTGAGGNHSDQSDGDAEHDVAPVEFMKQADFMPHPQREERVFWFPHWAVRRMLQQAWLFHLNLLLDFRRYDEVSSRALELLQQLDATPTDGGDDIKFRTEVLVMQARGHIGNGFLEIALVQLRHAVMVLRSASGPLSIAYRSAVDVGARALQQAGRIDEALEWYTELL